MATRSPVVGAPSAAFTPTPPPPPTKPPTLLGELDLHLFNEGSHFKLYDKLGAHPMVHGGVPGTYFAVWAPDAERVQVIGSWNGWDPSQNSLQPVASSGIWQGFIPGVKKGDLYKYQIVSRYHGHHAEKADPFAFHDEAPPRTASVVWDVDYEWHDEEWLDQRGSKIALEAPVSIYELHVGSWRRVPEEGNRALTYREMAPLLAEHVKSLGFTHVELLPVMPST
jgi:1,4-alpha-glucan branching enzyme